MRKNGPWFVHQFAQLARHCEIIKDGLKVSQVLQKSFEQYQYYKYNDIDHEQPGDHIAAVKNLSEIVSDRVNHILT